MTPITAVSKDRFKLISQYIFKRLPSNADEFRASLGYQILSQLSQSLPRLPYPSSQQPDHLDNYRRDIEAAPALLEDLNRLLQEGYLDKADAKGKASKSKRQRGKTQQSKVTLVAHAVINDRLFKALGREAPRNRESAEELLQSIIASQRNILEV